MFCTNCGKEIDDKAAVCVHCGKVVKKPKPAPKAKPEQDTEDPTNSLIIIATVLFPIVGIIIGAINLNSGKERSGKIYLVIGIIMMIMWMILFFVLPILITMIGHLIFFPFLL